MPLNAPLLHVDGPLLTLPNIVSMSRVVLLAPFIFCNSNYIDSPSPRNLLCLMLLALAAIVSDYLDGFLARKRKTQYRLGRVIDGLADHIVIITVLVILLTDYNFPVWAAVVYFTRELLCSALGLYLFLARGITASSNIWGKILINVAAVCFLWYIAVPFLRTTVQDESILLLPEISVYILGFFMIASAISYYVQYWGFLFTKEKG